MLSNRLLAPTRLGTARIRRWSPLDLHGPLKSALVLLPLARARARALVLLRQHPAHCLVLLLTRPLVLRQLRRERRGHALGSSAAHRDRGRARVFDSLSRPLSPGALALPAHLAVVHAERQRVGAHQGGSARRDASGGRVLALVGDGSG